MKIRIVAGKEQYETYKTMLEKAGFVVSADATLVLTETALAQDTLLGEKDGTYEIIPLAKIVLIESFGRTIVLHTAGNQFEIRERLYELDNLLDDRRFQRINKSQIISKAGIGKIKPDLSGRIELILKNGMSVYVSRSYRREFQRFIGF